MQNLADALDSKHSLYKVLSANVKLFKNVILLKLAKDMMPENRIADKRREEENKRKQFKIVSFDEFRSADKKLVQISGKKFAKEEKAKEARFRERLVKEFA